MGKTYWMLASLLLTACSWTLTKRVRSLYTSDILPLLTDQGIKPYDLEPFCPLKYIQTRDILSPYDKQKVKLAGNTFECDICHKTFKSEHYIEQHFLRAHPNPPGQNEVCLADYCAFLPCDESFLPHRCVSVMESCITGPGKEKVIAAICYGEKDTEFWTVSTGGYIAFAIITAMLSFVYYMLIWSEEEEKPPDKASRLSLKSKLS